ncbi:amidase family protein [Brenneria goodwinii]|uniref:amidase family protein n=1 Tax=Brenneria goodwinii TaxID=1109412 RepID=UPI001C7D5617|nr:amidase family protein [Brenneria goodwinii]MCG8158349.1 amidase family protein [Brenneria goodwinii]MCG8161161.1 amidase family protein [Brenneria goodwinii]MCG8165421.1 amidase family protein [Brenneria goodwinii]MCG8169904.1 amidase family protein [Brenneria goodwinii]MCG8177124.1 amidase family protein [Brenneria goodwinii]
MKDIPELWQLSANEIASLIQLRDISARDVAQACLQRLEEVNPAINAVVDYRPEDTLAQAREVDRKLAAGEDAGPLAGVPVTIKVNVDQTGYANTNGLKAQKNLIATRNNPVVSSLLAAGALTVGRTNTPAFSYRWFTNNQLHGATLNPRNAALTPGGSSGGAAASVAAGMAAIGHGTDIAGSIRYPAYACGVHGLRPSFGRIAAYNASGAERTIGGQIMAVSGPIARSVADLSLALRAMSVGSADDPWWVPAPLNGPDMPRRAAVCLRPDGIDTAPEICQALLESADKLRDAGWIVDEVDELVSLEEAVAIQITLWMGDGYDGMVAAAEQEGDPGAITALAGQKAIAEQIGITDFSRALSRRLGIAREWAALLQEYPVVLLPVSAALPFANDLDLQGEAAYQHVWRSQLPMIGLPVTGLPALSLCTGYLPDQTPLGIQIVAGRFREDLCLAAGADIEARSPRLPLAGVPD